jgi:hypothetical protein
MRMRGILNQWGCKEGTILPSPPPTPIYLSSKVKIKSWGKYLINIIYHVTICFKGKSKMLKFSIFFFPPSNKKILKENIEHSRKFYSVEMIFQFTYLFI